jgi:hypothetical protein
MNAIPEWAPDGHGGVRVNAFIRSGPRDRPIAERYCAWPPSPGRAEKYRCETFGFCASKSLNGCRMGRSEGRDRKLFAESGASKSGVSERRPVPAGQVDLG